MNKKVGIISLLIGCLTFVSYVYLKQEQPKKQEDVYLKTVVFKDAEDELIPVSINFHSVVEREQEVKNRIDLMKSDQLTRYGLYPVLDQHLEVLSVNIDQQILTLNVNELAVENNAMNVLEALTFVLTDYDDVKQLKLQLDGKDIDSLPESHIPLTSLTKQFGLNNFMETSSLLHETIPVMAYQEKTIQQYSYYIPTTLRINENESVDQQVKTILNHVKSEIQVVDATMENGILTVELEPNILLDNETIDRTLQELIVLSLSTIQDVKDVQLKINQENIQVQESAEIQYNYIKI